MNPTLSFKISNLRWFVNTIREFGGEFVPIQLEPYTKVKSAEPILYVGAAHYREDDHGTLHRINPKRTKHTI